MVAGDAAGRKRRNMAHEFDSYPTETLAIFYRSALEDMRKAEAAGRSQRTLDKYWKRVWRFEDALKARGGF